MDNDKKHILMKALKRLKPSAAIIEGKNGLTCLTDSRATFTQDGIKHGDLVWVDSKPMGCVRRSTETALPLTKWNPRYLFAWITWGWGKMKGWLKT